MKQNGRFPVLLIWMRGEQSIMQREITDSIPEDFKTTFEQAKELDSLNVILRGGTLIDRVTLSVWSAREDMTNGSTKRAHRQRRVGTLTSLHSPSVNYGCQVGMIPFQNPASISTKVPHKHALANGPPLVCLIPRVRASLLPRAFLLSDPGSWLLSHAGGTKTLVRRTPHHDEASDR